MHPNPSFRATAKDQNLAFARERSFGVLTISAADGPPLISHIPFLLDPDTNTADLHLVRSNPMTRAVQGSVAARLAVTGPDSYVSPDWYGVGDQVPTWNYVAVHLTGQLEPLPQNQLSDLLERLSQHFEDQLLPKPAWHHSKMDADAYTRMLRMIMPFRLRIDTVDGTWKLGQNKPNDVRQRAAEHMHTYGIGSDVRVLAALMQSPISDPSQE